MQAEDSMTPVTIGYYPFRAKAQVLRLLCEYLHVPYMDRFYNPDQRTQDRHRKRSQCVSTEFPFLNHDGFVLTGNYAMMAYIIQLSGKEDFLGKSLEHRARIDQFKLKGNLEDIIFGYINCSRQTNDHEEFQKRSQMKGFHQQKIISLMDMHEQECTPGKFYFGYLTIQDFSIYEIVNYFKRLFPKQLHRYPKLTSIAEKIGKLPEISAYEHSQRRVKEYCPIRYFKKYKQSQMRTLRHFNYMQQQTTASEMISQ